MTESKEKQKFKASLKETNSRTKKIENKAMKNESKPSQSAALIKPVSFSCDVCKRQFFRKGNFYEL